MDCGVITADESQHVVQHGERTTDLELAEWATPIGQQTSTDLTLSNMRMDRVPGSSSAVELRVC